MSKPLKIIAILVSILVLLFVGGVIFLTKGIDPNNFKNEISQVVQSRTGHSLAINGEIHWSFFPWVGLKVTQIQLDNPPGFSNEPLATIGEADIKIRALPLLVRKIEIGKIVLNNTYIHLIKNKDGLTNWQIPNQNTQPQPAPTASKPSLSKSSSFFKLDNIEQLAVATIEIENANLFWEDQDTGQSFKVSQLKLQGSC